MKTTLSLVVLVLAAAVFDPPVEKETKNMKPKQELLVDFGSPEIEPWQAVNDVVMGGISRSGLTRTGDGTVVFAGDVSLENNGGFASVRTSIGKTDLSSYGGMVVRARGDGKRYRLRLRTDDRFDGIAYQANFDTVLDEWREVRLPFESFAPIYRGRTPRNAPPLDTGKISQIGLMIADKQEGRFRLEIAWIGVYSAPTRED